MSSDMNSLMEGWRKFQKNSSSRSSRIDECIIVAGESGGDHVLAKSRDRNYYFIR